MSKEQMAKRKEEILAAIKDPKVREHYRLQLDMAEELEQEGIATSFHETNVFTEKREEDERDMEKRVAKLAVEEARKQDLVWLVTCVIVGCLVYALWRLL